MTTRTSPPYISENTCSLILPETQTTFGSVRSTDFKLYRYKGNMWSMFDCATELGLDFDRGKMDSLYPYFQDQQLKKNKHTSQLFVQKQCWLHGLHLCFCSNGLDTSFLSPKMEGGVSMLLLPRLITDCGLRWVEEVKAFKLPNVNNNNSSSSDDDNDNNNNTSRFVLLQKWQWQRNRNGVTVNTKRIWSIPFLSRSSICPLPVGINLMSINNTLRILWTKHTHTHKKP